MADCPICNGSGLLGCNCSSIQTPRLNIHCEDCVRKGYYCSSDCAATAQESAE